MPVHERYKQFQKDQRQFFDELIAEDWITYQSEEWDYTRKFEVKQLFRHIKPARILDVGCGVGFHDVVMAEYPFVEHVDAFDYSEQSVVRANREYSHLKINRFVADFISFKVEQPYDMVISFQVFEHLAEPEKYLAFCVDACCKGGVVGICTPNRLRFDNRLLIRNGQPPVLVDVMHFREYTAKEIYRMGRQFGLKPSGWFGHTLYLSSSWASSWSAKWNYRQRTQMGYLFPHIAHVMCVLLRKG